MVVACADASLLSPRAKSNLRGAVFEVRQGYKSGDSKRQNADLSNASNAATEDYLPVILLLSNQIAGVVANRYVAAKIVLLRGTTGGDPTRCTYAFCRDVLGYDLAGFFRRNSPAIRAEVERVLAALLGAR